jgi:hypothetical protein
MMFDIKRTMLLRLFAAPVRKNRLSGGRCACHETTVRWCTRHGRPVAAARRRVDELALT